MVPAEDVIRIYQGLSANGIHLWLSGGWGIDALLQVQTRPHKDLDVIMLVDDVDRMRSLLARAGYSLRKLWPENNWVVDTRGNQTPTAFVLRDTEGHELDAHAMRIDDHGSGMPAWAIDEGLVREKGSRRRGHDWRLGGPLPFSRDAGAVPYRP